MNVKHYTSSKLLLFTVLWHEDYIIHLLLDGSKRFNIFLFLLHDHRWRCVN